MAFEHVRYVAVSASLSNKIVLFSNEFAPSLSIEKLFNHIAEVIIRKQHECDIARASKKFPIDGQIHR